VEHPRDPAGSGRGPRVTGQVTEKVAVPYPRLQRPDPQDAERRDQSTSAGCFRQRIQQCRVSLPH
jgi:hypothetical protein